MKTTEIFHINRIMKFHTLQLPITDIRPPETEYIFSFQFSSLCKWKHKFLEGLLFEVSGIPDQGSLRP